MQQVTYGFEEAATKEELKILKAFREGCLVWPVDTGFTDSETRRLLNSLKRKVFIKGKGPYRLTAKGKRVYSLLTNS